MYYNCQYLQLIITSPLQQKQHCNDHCFSNDAMNTAMLSLSTRSEFHIIEKCVCARARARARVCMHKDKYTIPCQLHFFL